MILSKRVQRIKPSATLAVTAKAAALKAQGQDIIGLGVGEPDFDTPEFIKAAAIRAIQQGQTKYTAVEGTLALRQAIVQKFKLDNNLSYTPKQILVSTGGKQSFYNLVQALLNPADEVIIPAPYWVSYPDMVLLADGQPVMIETHAEHRYKITAQQLKQAITPKTRALVLNSPSNPSGMAYTKAELIALGEVLLDHPHIVVITDDMYEKIYWGSEPFCNIVMACPALYERCVIIHGVSKTYAMTGWRIGYAAGPEPLIKAMTDIQSQNTSNACSIAQAAALAALTGDQACVAAMTQVFKQRHDWVVQELNALPGITCLPADGTFYAFVDVSLAMSQLQIVSDSEFCEYLLQKVGVALVPGSAFGTPGHVRMSFAASNETLAAALQRLAQALKN